MNEKNKKVFEKISHITTRVQMGDSAYIAKLLFENAALKDRTEKAEDLLQAINFAEICSDFGPLTRAEVSLKAWEHLRDTRGVDYANGEGCYLLQEIPAKQETKLTWPLNDSNRIFFDLAHGKITQSPCPCEKCEKEYRPEGYLGRHFFTICPICGNKRCPKGTDHDLECTNSNEPGQKGSSWEDYQTTLKNLDKSVMDIQSVMDIISEQCKKEGFDPYQTENVEVSVSKCLEAIHIEQNLVKSPPEASPIEYHNEGSVCTPEKPVWPPCQEETEGFGDWATNFWNWITKPFKK